MLEGLQVWAHGAVPTLASTTWRVTGLAGVVFEEPVSCRKDFPLLFCS